MYIFSFIYLSYISSHPGILYDGANDSNTIFPFIWVDVLLSYEMHGNFIP